MQTPTAREAATALTTHCVTRPGADCVDLAAQYVADVPVEQRMTFVVALVATLAADAAEQVRLVGRLARDGAS